MDRLISLPLLLVVLITAAQPAWAKMYRWTDAEGNTHYSDKIPREAIEGSHSTINQRGLITDTKDAARSAEAYARELEVKRLRAEQQKELERQQAKDRVLLNTFRADDDIILARDGKLASYDAQIRIVYDNINRLKQRLQSQQTRAATTERKGKPLAERTLQGMENTRLEIKGNYESILRQEHDKERIQVKYTTDLERFRKLKEIQNSSLATAAFDDSSGKANVLVETAIECRDDAHCDSLWKKALVYGKSHATTAIYADSSRIFMTRPAVTEQDISITVSRIRPDKKGKEVIFLDVQCKKTIASETWCRKPKAETIRTGFKPAMAQ